MAQTVPAFVHQSVNLTHVVTRTDRVRVPQGGRVIIAPQVMLAKYLLFHIFIGKNKDKTFAVYTNDLKKKYLKHFDNAIISIFCGGFLTSFLYF